jgi:hypothetical protein
MSQWTDFLNLFTHFSQASADKVVADLQSDVQVAEADLARFGAWIVANGPTIISGAQTFISVLAALSGNLTIPAGVISVLKVAIADSQQFLTAVEKVTPATFTSASVVGAFAAVPDGKEAPGTLISGYRVMNALTAATAEARLALAGVKK